MFCEEQSLSSSSGGAGGNAHLSDGRRTTTSLPIHAVGDDLVSKLKTIIDRASSIIIFRIFHHLFVFLSFCQQNLKGLGQNAREHWLVSLWLNIGADCLATRFLVVVFHLVQHIPRSLQLLHGRIRHAFALGIDLLVVGVKHSQTHQRIW